MSKRLFIAEKPSVAKEFAKVLGVGGAGRDGYIESGDAVVTWCVGHLIDQPVYVFTLASRVGADIYCIHIITKKQSAYNIELLLYLRYDLI